MFYMPKYHNLPDGRQVFLRFPDPARHALPVSRLLTAVPSGEAGEAYLQAANTDPQRLVLLAEIGDSLAGCGLLELGDHPQMQVAIDEPCRGLGLEQLLEEALAGVAAQKGVELWPCGRRCNITVLRHPERNAVKPKDLRTSSP